MYLFHNRSVNFREKRKDPELIRVISLHCRVYEDQNLLENRPVENHR